MKLTQERMKEIFKKYEQLKALINARQMLESKHWDEEPYKSHPTTLSFPDPEGWCLLQLAACLGSIDEVKKLIEYNHINVSHQMPKGNISALAVALVYGYHEMARYLIDHGAQITEVDRSFLDDPESLKIYDEQARQIINEAKSRDVRLAERIPKTQKSYVDLAVEIGDIETVRQSNTPETPLLNSAKYLSDHDENLVMHRAVEYQQNEILDYILSLKFPLEMVNKFNQTPLHLAIMNGNWEMAKKLLGHGADINTQDIRGWTPLYAAIYYGKEECVKGLLAHGANPFLTTYLDETIYHAQAVSNIDLARLLSGVENLTTDSTDTLQKKHTIYGESPEDYSKNASKIRLNQGAVINKIDYYLQLNYRDKDYFSEGGYCNGLSFLYHYYDSKHKLETFYKILEAWVNWNGTQEGLEEKPKAPLDEYKNFGEFFEEFLGHLTLFQISTVPDIPLNQGIVKSKWLF